MRVAQLSWSETAGWTAVSGDRANADLVFFFGIRQALACGARYRELRAMFPSAHILGCSTGGQIHNDDVTDDEIAAAAIDFDATKLRIACEPAPAPECSRTCGATIGRVLAAPDLVGIFVLSDGLNVNGSELVAGITGVVGRQVAVTGGLAGDGADFRETLVGANCAPRKQTVAAVGFYGSAIRIGHGSAGGWDEFGPRRQITRSRGNVLFEFDGQPALDLYELYLGDEEARGLPGSGLLFPLRIFDPERPDHDIVRTILAVDHEAHSMTFAGDVPEGWTAQLMRGNFDRLAAGAAMAARQAADSLGQTRTGDQLAILVSCIGRRLLMGQHTADELEAASGEFGPHIPQLGFYSYGEISPHRVSGVCELHNQTMTVTTIAEVPEHAGA
ncbi:MAG: FIST N-terminal domain-containing protein [Xanthobacteraceae bacterium]